MIQHLFNSGSVLRISDIDLFQFWNTEQVMQDEIRILVDTNTPRTVILPSIIGFPVQNVRITVVDIYGAAAANNITVQATPFDTINGTSTLVINGNYNAFRFEPLNTGEWFTVNVGAGGGGGNSLSVSMTYNQLITNINNNTLITGQRILLTDYATASYIQFSGTPPTGVGNEQVHVGATEPLLLTAISNNEVSLVAESISNSQDLILYEPVMADGNYEYAAAQGKGCITFRMDRSINVSRDYDYRNVVFRRWETVIGNGKFYSYTPVTGAAFQDTLCFPQGLSATQLRNVSVGSPLATRAAFNNYPYWLDNTIINVNGAFNTYIAIGVANTFQYSAGSPANSVVSVNNINIASYNIVVAQDFVGNVISMLGSNNIQLPSNGQMIFNNCLDVANNTISVKFSGNTVIGISGNTCQDISDNTGNGINNNNMPNNHIGNNYAVSMSGNTCTGDILNNVSATIQNNSCGSIQDNLVDDIQGNGAQVTSITGNIAATINNNTNAGNISSNTVGSGINSNSNNGIIGKNQCYEISTNSNNGTIDGNMCNAINGNLALVGNISDNVANNIGANNNTGEIAFNTSGDITSNTNAGNIINNTVNYINGNVTPCALIAQNTGFQILNNGNGGQIFRNVVSSIDANTTGGEISNNTCVLISTNTGTGAITFNNVMQIVANHTGIITLNSGYTISGNTITGTITGNFCLYIDNIVEVAPAHADLTYNWSENLTNLTLHGVLLDVNGRLNSCTVMADVKQHTFIDGIDSRTITPTAEMSNGTNPTKSVYDEGILQYVLFVVNSGVASYATVIA